MSKTFNPKRQDKEIKYFIIMQNNFLEEDGYGIPETYPNHNKVIVDSRVILVGKNKGMRNLLRGYATVKSVEYHD